MSFATRSPQQARSARTQQRLLNATIEELASSGYTELRTAAVAVRCGMSQGTVFAHFGTKVRLVVAAVQHYFAREVRVDRVTIDPGHAIEERVWGLLEVMWEEMRSDAYLGVLEVYSAARTNEELRLAMAPVAAGEIERANAIGTRVFNSIAGSEPKRPTEARYEELIATLVYTLQAAAREAATLGVLEMPLPLMRFLQAQIVRELRAPGAPKERR
ncbi:MAG: TetR/AcrR family transcriptional regulator [Myxococcota bacterium]